MNILVTMLMYGFFACLKSAGIYNPESNRVNIWVGYAVCILLLLMQFLRLGSGRGEIFWIVFVLVAAAALFLTISLFGKNVETMDVLSIIMYTLSIVVLRVSVLTIFTGIALITLFYPMANTYVRGDNFLKFDSRTIIRVVVVFGLVVFWFGAHESITIDILQILNMVINL